MRPLTIFLLSLYCVLGTYGSLWISDEFDAFRQGFFAFLAIPLAFLFLFITTYFPQFWRRRRKLQRVHITIMMLAFAWGHVLLLNAVTGGRTERLHDVQQTDEEDKKPMLSMRARGGLGILYRARW